MRIGSPAACARAARTPAEYRLLAGRAGLPQATVRRAWPERVIMVWETAEAVEELDQTRLASPALTLVADDIEPAADGQRLAQRSGHLRAESQPQVPTAVLACNDCLPRRSRAGVGGWDIHVHDTRNDSDLGVINCEHFVNAGGLWAREVGRMTGLELPILAMEQVHQLIDAADPRYAPAIWLLVLARPATL